MDPMHGPHVRAGVLECWCPVAKLAKSVDSVVVSWTAIPNVFETFAEAIAAHDFGPRRSPETCASVDIRAPARRKIGLTH